MIAEAPLMGCWNNLLLGRFLYEKERLFSICTLQKGFVFKFKVSRSAGELIRVTHLQGFALIIRSDN